ncbi:MAG TPA: carbonic anhydrase [Acidimicrobiales bacterium]
MSSDRATFAAAVTCIDGRVHPPLARWVRERYGVDHVDLLTQPGPDLALCCAADGEVAHLRDHLGVSARAHRPGVLVVAGHADCAANPVPEAEHRRHLRRALDRARAWAPDGMPVVAVWVDRDGTVAEVAGTADPGAGAESR